MIKQKEIKLSKDSIKNIKKLNLELDGLTHTMGEIQIQSFLLEGKKHGVLEEIMSVKEQLQVEGKELESKYGAGTVDLDKGTFTPN